MTSATSKTPKGKPVKEGWISRESTVVERLLNKRYGALYSASFVTYRKDTDDSPSKVWPITKDVTLTPVGDHDYNMRHAGTSTLWAVARGAYDKLHMWGFSVTWSGTVSGPDKLALAFETRDDADEWHLAFSQAIEKVSASAPRVLAVGKPERPITNAEDGSTFGGAPPDAAKVPGSAASQASLAEVPTERRRSRAWASVLHMNGISVYAEEQDEDGEGGAIMVSSVVRAPPRDVFKNLVQVRKTESLGVFAGARIVEVIDATTQVVTQSWRGSGIVGGMCAPREMVLLRTWRRDEDGTYIVLYQSTTHRSVRGATGWAWRRPVRVQVKAAGFTIAPLLPKYTAAGESEESLVTLVLKADLGGWLSDSGGLVSRLLSPLSGPAMYSMLEPVVTSIVVLRDCVEQDRFVVRPLSMSAEEEPVEPLPPEGEPFHQGARMLRTSTMLIYGKEPLVLAQRLAAVEPAATPAADAGAALAAGEDADAWAIPGTCSKEYWSSPGSCGFKIRGASYMVDRKKVPAAVPMFELVAVDMVELEEPLSHICRHLPSVSRSPAPFLFCVQLMVPCTPPVSMVCSWAAPMPVLGATAASLISQFEEQQGPCPENVAAFFRAFTEFIDGDGPDADKRRNQRFKLIPNIAKGSWVIKQSVGTTPVLLGQKLATKYFRGANYFEVDVDIGSSSVAASITNVVCGATKSLTLDMGVLIEGQSPEQLPEQLIGTVRLDRLNLKTASYFDESTGRLLKAEELGGV